MRASPTRSGATRATAPLAERFAYNRVLPALDWALLPMIPTNAKIHARDQPVTMTSSAAARTGLLQVELLEQPRRGLARLSAGEALQPPEQPEVLARGEVLVDRGVLPGDPEQLPHLVRPAADVDAEDPCLPPSMGSRVASICSIVVLPAPLGPRTPKISPRRTRRSTPSTARGRRTA